MEPWGKRLEAMIITSPADAWNHPSGRKKGRRVDGLEPFISNERASFILPILESRGWSFRDWSNHSGLDHHTLSDYVNGKTRPYPSTLFKIAKSLGVEVRDLPKGPTVPNSPQLSNSG